MGEFIIKRLLLCVLILFFVMFIVYALMFSLPTSYVDTMARELATKPGSTKSAQEWLEELNAAYGFDRGIVGGYFTWLSTVLTGDFGDSWYYTLPVVEKFNDVIWFSVAMSLAAFIFETVIGVYLGVTAARKQYSITDYTVTVVALLCISMPTFFLATLLKLIFSIKLGWFDLIGMQSRDYMLLSDFGKFLDLCHHMVLPVITLTMLGIGGLMRYTRTNMLEVLNSDYIRTARAKGLREKVVIYSHAWRNALLPVITVIISWFLSIFSGSVIVETTFTLNGMGQLYYQALRNSDYELALACQMFYCVVSLVGALIMDLSYGLVDPRVRVDK